MSFRPSWATHDRWPLTVPVSAAAGVGPKRRNRPAFNPTSSNPTTPTTRPHPSIPSPEVFHPTTLLCFPDELATDAGGKWTIASIECDHALILPHWARYWHSDFPCFCRLLRAWFLRAQAFSFRTRALA